MDLADVKKIAVIGAGTMGSGIAVSFARAGYAVSLVDTAETALDRAGKTIEASLKLFCDNGLLGGVDVTDVASQITPTTAFPTGVEDVDFVVECVSEVLEIKQRLFKALDESCVPHAILATNTSGLSPTQIGARARRKDKIIAAHFWNPAHLMPLVEICGAEDTSEETIRITHDLLLRIGKKPVIVRKELLGFLGSRLQEALVREAIFLVEKGYAEPEDIDTVVKMSFGLRYPVVGPLETSDLAGLDVKLSIEEYLLKDLDRSVEPSPLLKNKVAHGELGAKTGKGFYDWSVRDAGKLGIERDRELVARIVKLEQGS
ncbi:MAG: 3-hydroxyacyl-CoA dehydrogenase family protein [Chloroflexi bacterium]|nr:3-hydroxyacyl-CoA dehydrogenase family protein [Chloroflexota bacterium]